MTSSPDAEKLQQRQWEKIHTQPLEIYGTTSSGFWKAKITWHGYLTIWNILEDGG